MDNRVKNSDLMTLTSTKGVALNAPIPAVGCAPLAGRYYRPSHQTGAHAAITVDLAAPLDVAGLRRHPNQDLAAQRADAYRLYRKRLLERMATTHNPQLGEDFFASLATNPSLHPAMPAPVLADSAKPHPKASLRDRSLILAACIFLVGAGVGYGLLHHQIMPSPRFAGQASLARAGFSPASTPNPALGGSSTLKATPPAAFIKPVKIVALDVENTIGAAQEQIPLSIQAEPAFAAQQLHLRLTNLPLGVTLNQGMRVANQDWEIPLPLAQDLTLFAPSASLQRLTVGAAAIETNTGDYASPIKEFNVFITPQLAVPEVSHSSPAPTADQAFQVKSQPSAAPALIRIIPTNDAPN